MQLDTPPPRGRMRAAAAPSASDQAAEARVCFRLVRQLVAAFGLGDLAALGERGEQGARGSGRDAGRLRDLRSGHRSAFERLEDLGLVLPARRATGCRRRWPGATSRLGLGARRCGGLTASATAADLRSRGTLEPAE